MLGFAQLSSSSATSSFSAMCDASPSTVVKTVVCTSFFAYLYFKTYEPDYRNRMALFTLLAIVPSLLSLFAAQQPMAPALSIFMTFASYYTLILIFTVTYRLSPFHPLAHYPGPVLPKISKWYSSYVCFQGKQHLWYQALHERYGDIVRVGPNELSIRDASAIPDACSLLKGPIWDNRSNPVVLVGERDVDVHARRRKTWNRGLTSTALKEYEVLVEARARQLVERFECLSQEGKARVDIASWLSYFATDFMGDMAFGGGFELMRAGCDECGVWTSITKGMESIALLAHASWSIPFISCIPGLANNQRIKAMREFGKKSTLNRIKIGAVRKDLFYHLNDEDQRESVRPALSTMIADGLLAIIAGSDTTSTVLSSVVYFLLRHPAVYERLQEEIAEHFMPEEDPTDAARLSRMPWLNACINEAMRLLPPNPSGSQRTIPKGTGPKTVGPFVIPEQTQIIAHTYSIQRDSRNFSVPDAYLPERWLSTEKQSQKPDITVHNPAAFFPFSVGSTSCAGKNLAMLEMRMVLCWLLQRFDMKFAAEGVQGDRWEESLEDYYIVHKGSMWVGMTPRC